MRRGAILQPLLRGVAGFVLGFALWAGLTQPYNRLLASSAGGLIRLFEHPDRTELRAEGKQVLVYRSDVPPGSTRPGIPAYDLTFNVILLAVLFAVDPHPLSNRNVGFFAVAIAILIPTHVLALVAWVQDLYASRFGPISERYSGAERALWANGLYFYRLVGQFAIPLILRWSLTPQASLDGRTRGYNSGGRHPARRRKR